MSIGSLPVPPGAPGPVSRLLMRQVQAVDQGPHQVGSGGQQYLVEVENHWAHEKICFRSGAM
ncbi:hypothetical protein Q9L58_010595 [Maublancomyces gigas]|uniref:Uncharacterized protein n=1 Tax=Discina gigas TaxID=1032678 RepID=A0ABR3G424_9PEZI